MPAIFISYRRRDAGPVDRLYDQLLKHFGANQVFLDRGSLTPGEQWPSIVERELASCVVVLAVIGNGWADSFRERHPAGDLVLLELETALRLQRTVIPLVVADDGAMPLKKELPDSIAPVLDTFGISLAEPVPRYYTDKVQTLAEQVKELIKARVPDEEAAPAVHSTDLWDYLRYVDAMPSRADRDRLASSHHPGAARQLQLWDYFFPFHPNDVGKPLRDERAALAEKSSELPQRLGQRIAEGREAAQALRGRLEAADEARGAQYAELQEGSFRQQRTTARRLYATGIALAVPLMIFLVMLAGSGPSSGSGFAESVRGMKATCGGFAVVGFTIASLVVLARAARAASPSRQQALAAQGTKTFVESWQQEQVTQQAAIAAALAGVTRAESDLAAREKGIAARDFALEQQLHLLLRQLPERPGAEQVESWFRADLAALRERAVAAAAARGFALDGLPDAHNPVCLWGPAGLQSDSRVPAPYRERGSDLWKRLWANRSTQSDRTLHDHCAACTVHFLFFGKDALASYEVFYDFIQAQRLGEQVHVVPWREVDGVEITHGDRQVPGRNSEPRYLSAPVLGIAPRRADRIEITLANDDFRRLLQEADGYGAAPARGDRGGAQEGPVDWEAIAEDVRRNVAQRSESAKRRPRPPG
jgi:hypothetical protein